MVLGASVMLPSAAQAACSGTGTITCSSTGTDSFTYAPGSGVPATITATINSSTVWNGTTNNSSTTLGYFNVNGSASASNNITLTVHGATLTNSKNNALAIQLISGANGTVDVTIDSGATINASNDILRLRNSTTSPPTGTGKIVVHTAGILNNTTPTSGSPGQGIDAKSGSGGLEIYVTGGSVSSSLSQGIVAEAGGTGSTWGDITVSVSEGGTVTGGTTTTGAVSGSGIWAFISSSSSDGTITVTNSGTVRGFQASGATAANGSRGAVELSTLGSGLVTFDNEGGEVSSTRGTGVYARAAAGGIEVSNTEGGSITGVTGVDAVSIGTFTLTNEGHIQGSAGSGVSAQNGTVANITNHSLNSIISGSTSASGLYVYNYDQVTFDNIGGLTAGLEGGGASILQTSGDNVTEGDVVAVLNYNGGVIVGSGGYGLEIGDVGVPSEGGGRSVFVDNAGGFERGGGLILSLGGRGLSVTNTEGDVYINNSLTRNWVTSDLTQSHIDAQVAVDNESGLLHPLPGMLATVGLDGEFAGGTGIWGFESGIYGSGIDGHVAIDNHRGLIIGMDDGSRGIQLNNVGDGVSIDNSSFTFPGSISSYSLVLGSGGGVDLQNITGDVWYNNSLGITYGHGGDGLHVDGVTEGGVYIANAAGMLESYLFDAVSVVDVSEHVQIDNQFGESNWFGGDILGGRSAISIVDAESAEINNGFSWYDWQSESWQGGLIASRGGNSGTEAVIYLDTSNGEGGGSVINNYGIIASLGPNAYPFNIDSEGAAVENESFDSYLPGVGIPIALNQKPGDLGQIYADAYYIREAVAGGGSDTLASLLSPYARAASALVIQSSSSESGAVEIYNRDPAGIIFGTVDLSGSNPGYSEGESWGNYFNNTGKWFTRGTNDLLGSGVDVIQNDGLIQTAFGGEGGEITTFNVDYFYNDAPEGGLTGIVSQMDGDIRDQITINANDFYGSNGEGGTSLFALDAFLTGADGEGGGADYFYISGYVHGTTGIIVNNINPSVSTSANPDGFLVVHAEDGVGVYDGIGGDCYGSYNDYCKYGDAFYISDATKNYETVGGFGTIRDGLYSWFLQQREDETEGDNFFLVSQLSPDGHDQPGLSALAVQIGLDGLNTAEENDSGNTFPLTQGGGGADPTSAKGKSAIWGRLTGNWTRRNTTIDDGGVPYDTGTSQNTYAITGGLEFRPDGGDSGVRLGIYGGYSQGDSAFDTFNGSAKASGGTVGGYAALSSGGWYVDGEIKADFLGLTFTSPTVSIDTHGTVLSGLVNTGYRMESGNSFFEPIASVSYSNANIADATVGLATLTYDNAQSIRAGLGARIGTTIGTPGGTQTELAVMGKVWDEFGGPYTVTIDDGTPLVASQSIAGVFGEVVGRATIYNADRSSSGFLSLGGKFGSSMSSISAKAGIRKNF